MAIEKSTHQSVEKAFVVLGALSGGHALRVGDVARATGLGQSTASRLLSTLEASGYVQRDPATSLYSLGSQLLTLAGVALNHEPVHRAGRQIAQALAHRTGLGVNIAVRRADDAVYLASFEGAQSPKSHTLMGQRVPLHATSVGKCMLLGPDGQIAGELPARLVRFTDFTVTDHETLLGEITAAARQGYAMEVEEYVLGRASIAAPIFDQNGIVQGGISISGPRSTIDLETREEELAQIVVETADRISSGLGYQGPGN